MNRSCKMSLFLIAFLGTTPSFAVSPRVVEPQPFLPPPGESIKSIALLKISEPRGYFLGEGGLGAGGAIFGIPGILAETFAEPDHPEYENTGFHFSAVAERRLTEHLKAAGFSVVSVPLDRKKPNQLLRDYNALSVPNVDAYLDVAALGVGYRKSFTGAWPFAHKVGPYVSVAVRLVSARSKKILYTDIIEYAWSKARNPGVEGTDIDAPDDHVFKDTEAVQMDLASADSRSILALTQGIDVGMRTIVSAFSSYPAIELPQQAGSRPRADSPIEVAKAAPAAVPSPSAALSTAYKIAIFPFDDEGCIGYTSRPSHEQFATQLGVLIRRKNALALTYSYYDKDLNYPPIKRPGRLWKGPRPNLAEVFSLGEARGVDAVVMYWRPAGGIGYCQGRMPPYPVHVYVIDVKQRKTHVLKGEEDKIATMIEQALANYLAGATPKVAATAPTKNSEVSRSQTASAASPFEGITLPPGGSVKAIHAAAEAYCGSLNKKSNLVAAPPKNPNYVFQCYPSMKAAPAPTPPTTVAKAGPTTQGTASYKIGIFPGAGEFAHGRGPGTPWEEKYAAQIFGNRMRANASSLSLAYSHYDPGLNQPRIYDYTKVWAGSKPKLSAIYREAGVRDLDAVFMYRGTGMYTNYNVPSGPMPIELYLIDVEQKRTYVQKGDTDRLEKMMDQLISRLLQGQAR